MDSVEALGVRRRLAVQILVSAELPAGLVLVVHTWFGGLETYAGVAAAAWAPVAAGNLDLYVGSPLLWTVIAAASFGSRFVVLRWLRVRRADRALLLDGREAGTRDRVAHALHGPQLVDDHPA